MPGGDGTGPMRRGPMTGGGFGPCGGGLARRFGRGGFHGRGGSSGGGRGWGNRRWAPDPPGWRRTAFWETAARPRTPDDERKILEDETSALENELERLQTRIAELKDGPGR